MDVFKNLENIKSEDRSVLTIGSFDGLHRGHQEIVKKVVAKAQSRHVKSVVITFDPHPRHVLDKDRKLPLLISLDKKLSLLKELQVDKVLVVPFTEEFSKIHAEKFMNQIVIENFNPDHIIIGHDHHFGYNREGSPKFIKDFCANQDFTCEVIESVTDDSVVLSSSHIRQLIQGGFVRRASFKLGWVYGFKVHVVQGAGRGKELSFPTANFIAIEENQLFPKNGVYFCRGRINSNSLYGMCNLGVRPTFDENDFVAEIHFFTEDINNLYKQEIEIEFLERIRDEQKFENADQLVQQLNKDKRYCNQLIQKYL
ncbi:MAG: bifunctional riboflavin kinase/FAD synthetase [Candidatus Marinimicrobia bacterium]|jgi:riboflavin kinase/FMN adenylyltransferase|nr:riboflavin biosynthesis protein RibF [Candidatus Neomarinimicrobiota bacterium]MDP6499313.1 bifunctional riboflavin kinase/FAD synthetase [Candidatus Neomarinimicrobiota bacterium]MDP6726309.1 bifunctional riboflavin kinase/FAD synthetase [Candidatus Neomarinimicrobiota bacterium]|tara:strand:+ start:11157 stop:12092 length:936 start_codon:yes stop_codon:yes gene_type:complete